jgi:hypothetical protein
MDKQAFVKGYIRISGIGKKKTKSQVVRKLSLAESLNLSRDGEKRLENLS